MYWCHAKSHCSVCLSNTCVSPSSSCLSTRPFIQAVMNLCVSLLCLSVCQRKERKMLLQQELSCSSSHEYQVWCCFRLNDLLALRFCSWCCFRCRRRRKEGGKKRRWWSCCCCYCRGLTSWTPGCLFLSCLASCISGSPWQVYREMYVFLEPLPPLLSSSLRVMLRCVSESLFTHLSSWMREHKRSHGGWSMFLWSLKSQQKQKEEECSSEWER